MNTPSNSNAGSGCPATTCYASSCGRVTLYLGDCMDIMPTLKDVDSVVTDPPYGMAWPADNSRFKGGTEASKKNRGKNSKPARPIIGDSKPFNPSHLLAFPQVAIFGANHMTDKLPVGTLLVWLKKHETGWGQFLSDGEVCWVKGGHGVYAKVDTSESGGDTTRHAKGIGRNHPNQKPVPIMAWCMDRAKVPEGATVLDPYMGSGSTGVAAIRTGRRFVGIEIDPTHYATALKRITDELAQGDLFLGHNVTMQAIRPDASADNTENDL